MASIDFEYKEFSAEFGRSFQGDNLKQLKFLISDYISSTILGNNSVTAIDLLDEVAKHREQNEVIASLNELKLFDEICELTKLGFLQDLVGDTSKPNPNSLDKGIGLKPYRGLFFKGIQEATGNDFFEARAFYDQTHNSDIKDLWDLALYLQVNDFLVTRKDLNRFADRLSGKAKGIIKDGLKDLVIKINEENVVKVEDRDIIRGDKDKLVNLTPLHPEDKESKKRRELRRIRAIPFKKPVVLNTQQGSDMPRYKMTSKQRGICLIINNIMFASDSKLSERVGSEIDEAYLERIFKHLGFIIEVKQNLPARKMKDVMDEMQRRDHSKYDCFVCCILSHGRLGMVYGSDGDSCKILELVSNFQSNNCKSLQSKPKVFFIQACRPQNPEDDGVEKIPDDTDFLFGYSTAPLTKSVRNLNRGTYFIRNLTKILEDYHHHHHILEILTHVNKVVRELTGSRVPAPQFTLTKNLYFPSVDQ